jgi:hypothetical protein
MWTCIFYGFLGLLEIPIIWFVMSVWWKATSHPKWRWTNPDSRDTYVDIAKTMITASGIAVALLATLALHREAGVNPNPLVVFSAKVATVCLIGCVCVSLILIIALARGHEQAKSRWMEVQRQVGISGPSFGTQGALSDFELRVILISSAVALSCFFDGFLFLGRIVFHF